MDAKMKFSEAKKTVTATFTLDESQAFKMLCDFLEITDVVYSKEKLYIHKGGVFRKTENGEFELVDNRPDLFAALRNVANSIWPDLEFRSDNYITHYDYEEVEDEEAEWIFKEVRGQMTNVCSKCGNTAVYDTYFCPNCGRIMTNGH